MHRFSAPFLFSAAFLAALALSPSAPGAVLLEAFPLAGPGPAPASSTAWAALEKLPADDCGANLRALRFDPGHEPRGVAGDEVSRSTTLLIGTGGALPAALEKDGARCAISVTTALNGGKAIRVAALDPAWITPELSESE